MNFPSTALLGAFAGLTIFFGLPVARLQNFKRSWQTLLNGMAVGILLFLLWDTLSKISEPINAALVSARTGNTGSFFSALGLFVGGFGFSLLGLVYFESAFIKRAAKNVQSGEATPARLAMMIAIGIGIHNFAEGLAIGQSARTGEIALATILIIGFALHNTTEGFGVAAPFSAGQRPSWRHLGMLGLIAGLPTFIGTVIGYSVFSESLFIFSLALAAGSILYILTELLNAGRRFGLREIAVWGIFVGLFAAYFTDLLLVFVGG